MKKEHTKDRVFVNHLDSASMRGMPLIAVVQSGSEHGEVFWVDGESCGFRHRLSDLERPTFGFRELIVSIRDKE